MIGVEKTMRDIKENCTIRWTLRWTREDKSEKDYQSTRAEFKSSETDMSF